MDADAIDLSKENIQPLRQGRKTAQLGLALKAQSDKDVQEQMLKERDSHELAILTYEGDDPLKPRHEYVQWIEQCCPKFGHESNIIPLLEDTIMMFKDDERYKQDPRFIELVIKYIDTQDNAPELYNIVHSQGVGTKCALLYKAWAECLDSCQNFKGTDQIYRLGISSAAQPVELLKELHSQFQLSVARRMLLGGDSNLSFQASEERVTERQRTVLGKLSKKSAASSMRFNHGGPGPMNALLSDSRSNRKINVYQEDENEDTFLTGTTTSKIGAFAKKEEVHKENLIKPKPWNQGFSKKQQRNEAPPPICSIPSTPTFQVLKDDDWDDNGEKANVDQSAPTPVTSFKVLKTRKSESVHKTPIQLFKSPHVSSVRNNMPKFEVYTGGKEFSFEELRLAYYDKHQKQKYEDEFIAGTTKEQNDHRITSGPSNVTNPLPIVEEDKEENYAFEVYCD